MCVCGVGRCVRIGVCAYLVSLHCVCVIYCVHVCVRVIGVVYVLCMQESGLVHSHIRHLGHPRLYPSLAAFAQCLHPPFDKLHELSWSSSVKVCKYDMRTLPTCVCI